MLAQSSGSTPIGSRQSLRGAGAPYSGLRSFAILPQVRFFDILNRWQTVLAVLVVAVGVNAWLYYFYLPQGAAPGGAPLPEQTGRTTLTTTPESTTPKTTLETTTLEKTTATATTTATGAP